MSKIAKRLICLFIIIIIVLISPFIVGKITQMQFTKLINNLNYLEKNKGIHLELLNYQKGWLKSKATFKISINKAKYYTEEVIIYNGPYIFNSSVHSFKDHFNLAYFEGNFSYGAINIQDIVKVEPIKLNYVGRMKYNLSSNFKISFNKFAAKLINDDISNPSSISFDVSAQKGEVFAFIPTPAVNAIKLDSQINNIKFHNNMISPADKNNMQKTIDYVANIKSIELSSTSKNVFKNNWQTNNLISENDAYGKLNIYKNNIFDLYPSKTPIKTINTSLKKLSLNFAKQINLSNNSADAYLKVFANQANIKILSKGKIKQDYSYDPIDFKIGIYNVNFRNLFKLENLLLKKSDNQKIKRMEISKQVLSLINKNTAFKLEAGYMGNKGNLFFNAKYNWPKINQNYVRSIFDIINLTQTKINISITKNLLNQYIKRLTQKLIPLLTSNFKIDNNINLNDITLDSDVSNTNNKPTTYNDSKLKILTGLQNIPLSTPDAKLIKDAQKQLKLYLNQLVNNGYIDKNEEGYYQTVLESKGPIATANGKMINTPYLMQMFNARV